MTGSPGSPEPAESPEIEEVRRLLADARHTEPMPDDVAARMDDVLAGLGATPSAASSSSAGTPARERDDRVVSLAAHRRRRAAGMLVAAAAIVVGGVAVAQNLPGSTSSSSESTAGSAAAQDSGQQPSRVRRSPTPETFSGSDARVRAAKPVLKDGRILVRPRRFSADALAGQQLLRKDDRPTVAQATCASVPKGGEVLQATYRQAPAALFYRAASGGSQVVDLYICGTHRPVRTTTLPAP
jgi:hypothetical protein